jgi:hypothetical protein
MINEEIFKQFITLYFYLVLSNNISNDCGCFRKIKLFKFVEKSCIPHLQSLFMEYLS